MIESTCPVGVGRVVHLNLLNGKAAGLEHSTRRFPLTIGRSTDCQFRVVEEGVWDHHAEIQLHQSREFVLSAGENASVTLNGNPVTKAVLRNGDLMQLGGARIHFSLSPPVSRGLKLRETLTWIGLGLLFVSQLVTIYWLVN